MTKIDPRLLLIKHLYGEEVSKEKLNELLEDPENRSEYEEHTRVKKQLENPALRKNVSAPSEVVERVFSLTSRPRHDWSRPVRRPLRLAFVSGALATAASVLLLFFFPSTPSEIPEAEVASEQLQWDDTQDRIEIQHALSVVRQRTSPDLWDESAVMNLDSLPFNSSPSGVETASSTPQ